MTDLEKTGNAASGAASADRKTAAALCFFMNLPGTFGVSVYRREVQDKMIDDYIRQYGRRLYGLCLHLCEGREDAEDLYQETWLKALQKLDTYDTNREFEPWLTRICVNTWRNVLRRRRRSPFYDGFATSEAKERLLSDAPAREPGDYDDLYAALRKLPQKLRETVVLYYFEDQNIQAAAQILKIPPGTVKSRLNQARKRLRGELKDEI